MISDHAAALAILLQDNTRASVRRLLGAEPDARALLRRLDRSHARRIAALRARLRALDTIVLAADEAGFPALAAGIPDPPLLLYLRGELDCLSRCGVAIVGARRASLLGRETASTLARTLASAGIAVISGLALGVDAAAHQGALAAAAGGATVAVLGSGLERVQPVANLPLADRIVREGGLLVSEYPLLTEARRHHFPERNRLISGLADAVVVVEAGERSGSLITARLALEQGREVLAVPGAITLPNARGVNRLLKQGAGLVDSAQDVFDALHMHHQPGERRAAAAALSAQARTLLSRMQELTQTIDALCTATGWPAARVMAVLTELELAGFVARSGGGYIRRPF